MTTFRAILALFALIQCSKAAFSWRGEKRAVEGRSAASPSCLPADIPPAHEVESDSSQITQREIHLHNIFSLALSELQELESEPLCHRVAARLLVNNCQLVDGKDEATILTDSGRQVRDFVDSYAASLAICDLERGSFIIPPECGKFREASLSQIAIRSEPQLHVSAHEIGLCLSALATSDAAWSTWISYRHKALRFCEAARGENEKAQNIALYQKLTKVVARLVKGVEADLEKRIKDLDNRAHQAAENIGQLSPQVDELRDKLRVVNDYLSGDIEKSLRRSSESMFDGLQSAESLQQLLSVLLATVHERNAQLAFAHEMSIRQAAEKTSGDIAALAGVVATAVASTSELHKQIAFSNEHAASLTRRQDAIEQGFDRLLITTQRLAATSESHTQVLQQAANITNDLLDTLEDTVSTAVSLNESLLFNGKSSGWWPYIICPGFTLVLGSYGLEPSAVRNFGLVALGEFVAFFVSIFSSDRLFDDSSLGSMNFTNSSLVPEGF